MSLKIVQFSPDAINDLKLFKSGNQNLAFKVFELITDIQSSQLGQTLPRRQAGCKVETLYFIRIIFLIAFKYLPARLVGWLSKL